LHTPTQPASPRADQHRVTRAPKHEYYDPSIPSPVHFLHL
jgi:hypothetical protein